MVKVVVACVSMSTHASVSMPSRRSAWRFLYLLRLLVLG